MYRSEQKSVQSGGLKAGSMMKLAMASTLALVLAGCSAHNDRAVKVGGLVATNAKANHPIRVVKKHIRMTIPVRRGDDRLSREKEMELAQFIDRYRREGEGRLVISAPAGQPNEVAAFNVLNNVRDVMKAQNIVRAMVQLKPYTPRGNPEAPIVISYLGYEAVGPKCGPLSRDMGSTRLNIPYENLACANQANMAAMIANPKDLVEPRGETPRSGERRDVQWKKFVEGKYMGREKSKEQKQSFIKN